MLHGTKSGRLQEPLGLLPGSIGLPLEACPFIVLWGCRACLCCPPFASPHQTVLPQLCCLQLRRCIEQSSCRDSHKPSQAMLTPKSQHVRCSCQVCSVNSLPGLQHGHCISSGQWATRRQTSCPVPTFPFYSQAAFVQLIRLARLFK